jgi:hypothetical protein
VVVYSATGLAACSLTLCSVFVRRGGGDDPLSVIRYPLSVIRYPLSVIILTFCFNVYATPLFSEQACSPLNTSNPYTAYSNSESISVYIESDLWSGFNACNSGEDFDSQYQSMVAILSAAEVWNREGRGPNLIYKGYVDYSEANEVTFFCNDSTIEEYSVFVRFSDDSFSDVATETVGTVSACPTNQKRSTLTIWGSDQGVGIECVPTSREYYLSGDPNQRDFVSFITHEFGHVLGMPDIDSSGNLNNSTNDPFAALPGRESVMAQSAPENFTTRSIESGRHLYPFDLDCVDDIANTRSERYYWNVYNETGNYFYGIDNTPARWTSKSSLSGGKNYFNNNSFEWGFYVQDEATAPCAYWDNIGYGSAFDFSSSNCSIYDDDLDLLPSKPVFFHPLEKGINNGNNVRVNYAEYPTAYTNVDTVDPPEWRYYRSDDNLSSATTNGLYYDNSNIAIRSNIPLVTTWDAASQNTVFARVHTDRTDPVFDYSGTIWLYAGFNTSSTQNTLGPINILLASNNNMPSSGTSFPYDAKTDVAPGMACGPYVSSDPERFNCILAWVDRGTPNGRVLYTSFRIRTTPSKQIIWSGVVKQVSGVNTVSDIGLSYTNNTFLLAAKTINGAPNVIVMQTGYDSDVMDNTWSQQSLFVRGDVVGAPQWLYTTTGVVPRVLYWTEAQ